MTDMNGKIAVITGGNSGIGLATAKELTSRGAHVVLFGRDATTLAEARSAVGGRTHAVQGDVSKLADLERLHNEVKTQFGRVDVLFVNAGITKPAPFEAMTEQVFDETFDINVKGAFFTVQKLGPLLAEGASVVLTSSCLADMGMPGMSAYSASKAAINSLARTLSAELLERNVRVNVVSPGPVNTPIYGKLGMSPEQLQEFAEGVRNQVPMKRFGSPQEIAKAVAFLASSDSAFMLGTEIVLDGGWGQL
jgi:NAD(P)-dependent dehydrogenase (short-subunit alcohol dehydrogenase family)